MTTVSDHAAAWVPDTSRFSARLALVRHHQGWNIKEAALACSLPQASWRSWELQDVRPRDLLQVCRAVSERTGVDLIWLLTGQVGSNSGDGAAIIRASLTGHIGDMTCENSRPGQPLFVGAAAA